MILAPMLADTQNDDKICGVKGSSSRVFEIRNSKATELQCRKECATSEYCKAMSGVFDVQDAWCIGCNVALDKPKSRAKTFKKESN